MSKDYTGGNQKMNTMQELQEVYPYNPQTRTFSIPVRVANYDDFFNPLDPSPAPTRDLTPELIDYLDQCSIELPDRYNIEILLQFPGQTPNEQSEKDCLASLRTSYKHNIIITQSEIREMRTKALKYLLVSFTCLAASIFMGKMNLTGFIFNLAQEALLIGGWVFMWEAVTLNFIEIDEYVKKIRKSKRLVNAKVIFTYDKQS